MSMRFNPLPVNSELAALIQRCRGYVMTRDEINEQRISFAYGNLAIEDDSVTKESVRKMAEEIYGKEQP